MPDKQNFFPRKRPGAYRDARLVIIAAEGTNTEKFYFYDLAETYANPQIHVVVLDRIETASSPGHIISQLDEFKARYRIKSGYDELWLVIDVDRWGEEKLADIARKAIQKQYHLAVSNPCFEIWLLIHHRSLDQYCPEIQSEFRENRKDRNGRTRLEKELLAILGRYNKNNLATEDFLPYIGQAIERGMALDSHPDDRWPNDLGSHVYRLALRIIE